jgi:hypothetical protein
MQEVDKVYGKADLPAYPGARRILPAEQGKIERHSFVKFKLASAQRLQLAPAQSRSVRFSAIDFGAESKAGTEVVLERQAASVNLSALRLNSYDAGRGVAREQET